MTSQLDLRLTTQYQKQLGDLRLRLGALAVRVWARLAAYNEADVADLVAGIEVGEAAARRSATHLTGGYLSLLTGEHIDLDPAALPAVAELWRQPFLTVWGQLGSGTPFDHAVAAGADRARSTGAQVISHTARAAATLFDEASNSITGWRRLPDGRACRWCINVSGRRYHTADTASLRDQHAHCSCEVVPITADTDPGGHLNARRLAAPADARYVAADGTAVATA